MSERVLTEAEVDALFAKWEDEWLDGRLDGLADLCDSHEALRLALAAANERVFGSTRWKSSPLVPMRISMRATHQLTDGVCDEGNT